MDPIFYLIGGAVALVLVVAVIVVVVRKAKGGAPVLRQEPSIDRNQRQHILVYLRANETIVAGDVVRLINVDPETAAHYLKELAKQNDIVEHEQGEGAFYYTLPEAPAENEPQ